MDISVNTPPTSGPYSGVFYTIIGTGGYTMVQGLPTIILRPPNPLVQYDVTNAVQILFDVRTFNKKLGLIKDASNIDISGTSYGYPSSNYNVAADLFYNDTITISAADLSNGLTTTSQIVSVGTYSTLYSDFETYVNSYFGYAGGFQSLYASVDSFAVNDGSFNPASFLELLHGNGAIDNSGAYINSLTGSITILGINNLLNFSINSNVFGNRDPSNCTTASNQTNYRIKDGFQAGDLIFIPGGLSITLNLSILNENDVSFNSNNPSQSSINSLNQSSNFTQKYGSNLYTVTTQASLTGITRTVTAPLLFILENLS